MDGGAGGGAGTSSPMNAALNSDLAGTQQLGTPSYAAPEQWSGQEAARAESDVFSLGLMVAELFCPTETQMERARLLEAARGSQKSPAAILPALWETCPSLAEALMAMTHPQPGMRPSAHKVLHSFLPRVWEEVSATLGPAAAAACPLLPPTTVQRSCSPTVLPAPHVSPVLSPLQSPEHSPDQPQSPTSHTTAVRRGSSQAGLTSSSCPPGSPSIPAFHLPHATIKPPTSASKTDSQPSNFAPPDRERRPRAPTTSPTLRCSRQSHEAATQTDENLNEAIDSD